MKVRTHWTFVIDGCEIRLRGTKPAARMEALKIRRDIEREIGGRVLFRLQARP